MNAGTDRHNDPTAAPAAGGNWRSARYQHWVARTSRTLDILAVVFLVDFLAGLLVPGGPPWWQPTLTAVSYGVWFAFVVDYLVRLSLSPVRWTFIQTHKLDLLMVALPMLRMLRVVILLRKAYKSLPTERIAGSLFTIVAVVVAAGAVLEWRVESVDPNANITTLGTAFWWAIVTTTTVGYGDTYPVTPTGRVIGAVIMVVGIGLIGTVSATVAAWLVNHQKQPPTRRADRAAGERKTASSETTAQENQAVSNQAVSNQGVSNQGVSNQGVSNQGVSNQGVSNQGVSNQGVSNQAVPNHAVPDHEGTETTATNAGTNTSMINPAAIPPPANGPQVAQPAPETVALTGMVATLTAQIDALRTQQADLRLAIDRLVEQKSP